jgi:hypothetical protein
MRASWWSTRFGDLCLAAGGERVSITRHSIVERKGFDNLTHYEVRQVPIFLAPVDVQRLFYVIQDVQMLRHVKQSVQPHLEELAASNVSSAAHFPNVLIKLVVIGHPLGSSLISS